MALPLKISRVVLENYKSISRCDVRLQPLTLLVGQNGAGKSNFLDALLFVNRVLQLGISPAVGERGGIEELLCHAPGRLGEVQQRWLAVALEMRLHDRVDASFRLVLRSSSPGTTFIQSEECTVDEHRDGQAPASYRLEHGKLEISLTMAQHMQASPDRLFLQSASGLPMFQPVYQALTQVRSYHVNPAALRILQPFAASTELASDASNIASVLWKLQQSNPPLLDRILRYLEAILPGLRGIETKQTGSYLIPHFHMASEDGSRTSDFPIAAMSDGTLRCLALLVALLNGFEAGTAGTGRLVLLEEPEMALHPGATRALLDAMSEASERSQVLATTHSPDLLDRKDIAAESILAVVAKDGVTSIGPVDDVARSALRDRLFTAGELLRTGALHTTGTYE